MSSQGQKDDRTEVHKSRIGQENLVRGLKIYPREKTTNFIIIIIPKLRFGQCMLLRIDLPLTTTE